MEQDWRYRPRGAAARWGLILAALTAPFFPAVAARAQTADQEGTFNEDAVDPAAAEVVEETAVDFQWNGGITAITGNAETFTANTGVNVSFQEGPHLLTSSLQFSLGFAAIDDDPETAGVDEEAAVFDNEVARNLLLQLRYDFFASDADALFLGLRGTHDPFAGLDFRLQVQPGYSRNFIATKESRFWGEVGYDLTVDWEDGGDDNPVDQHSARGFLGYTNKMNAFLTYNGGFEVLVDVVDAENTRLFWNNNITSKVNDVLSVSLEFRLIYDNQPVVTTVTDDLGNDVAVEAEALDTRTVFSFIVDII
jgi:putative salt-induced outer membrane protein YdiY